MAWLRSSPAAPGSWLSALCTAAATHTMVSTYQRKPRSTSIYLSDQPISINTDEPETMIEKSGEQGNIEQDSTGLTMTASYLMRSLLALLR
jgi:hypothetical protein